MDDKQTNGLKSVFTPLGVWAFSIGTSIGWGSFIVTCNTYLQKSGILGTVFGLITGMAVILVITWNLQYMICNTPDAGGVYTFEKRVGGKDIAFLTYWFVLLTYFAVLWANITSLPLFSRFFLGNTFQFGFHYSLFGYEVWFGEVLLSMFSVFLVGLLCANSSRIPNKIMIVAALVFTISFTVCALVAFMRHDSTMSYSPMYTEGSAAFAQIVRIAVISPWAFIGFENISHFSEEYTFPVKKVRSILLYSVLITTTLYIFVSVLSVSAYPPEYESWLAYIRDMGNLDGIKAVPAFYAAGYYMGQTGINVLMFALFGVILTSLIGNLLALSRLLYAVGRDGEAPRMLSEVNQNGIPGKAVYCVVFISFFIPFLGRTAIGWIVDVTTLGATIIYGLLSYAVYRHARSGGLKTEKYTGVAGMFLMGGFILLLLIPGLLPFDAMETESYVLFIVWSVLGLAYFRMLIRKDIKHEYGQRIIVWILLLLLVLFASMMWVSRATEKAAYRSVENIIEYHETHSTDDSVEEVKANRLAFLDEQAKHISSTNTLFTMVSLGLFVLTSMIILNNYRDTRKLGERLTAAEEAAEAARKIAELKQSISSLLDNMPGLNFSKDAGTGVYLACNQAFARYAHKDSPESVVGHTDDELFDAVTAGHFVQDDHMALSMDQPYIIYEDVLDGQGKSRQLQTTKLKYIDSSGRLCLLGMSQDVTDMVRIQRENALTKEAYEKARSNGVIYTHIAQTLARSYSDLYYVNIETGEFVEYISGGEGGILSEERRGEDFFDKCTEDIERLIHPDDRATIAGVMNKQAIVEVLDRNNSFLMTYRLMPGSGMEKEAIYVTMKISRMEDDENFIIIGISDVDEQVKQRMQAERMQEEHIAYSRLNALAGDFLCVYVIDPENDRYREYSATEGYEMLTLPKEGEDFFEVSRKNAQSVIYDEDLPHFMSVFTKEGVMEEIANSGFFAMNYRLVINNILTHVRLKAVIIEEKKGDRLIVGINDINEYVKQEEEHLMRLIQAQNEADIDALTGIRNRHAFENAMNELEKELEDNPQLQFAIVILDVNDLKKVNDVEGHKAGDQYLCNACRIICDIFKHSPVFRVGGDEFVVIVRGRDYLYLEELIYNMNKHNAEASGKGGIVIACGMSRFENDEGVTPVYERADRLMYENKSILKEGR